jgi:hypothetical protein
LQWNIDYMRLGYSYDEEPDLLSLRRASASIPVTEEVNEIEITIVTKEETFQVRVNHEKLVFDIVSEILQQIGTSQVFICTYLDISPLRTGKMCYKIFVTVTSGNIRPSVEIKRSECAQ